MAVTRIWPVSGQLDHPIDYARNPEKTENPHYSKAGFQAMEDVMGYAVNEEKTEKKFYVSGVNCNPDTARDQFITVKKQFSKEGGIIAYHAYQSFAKGEVTAEQAHEIGLEFAKRAWGEDYQVVVATHLNTSCLHNHFVVNSISFIHGKRCRKTMWKQLSKISDEVCRQHRLSVIENPNGKRIPIQVARAEKEGKATRLVMVKEAIDEAISMSSSMRELDLNLNKMGYILNYDANRKYWTIRLKSWERPIRLMRIGEDYSNERIYERVTKSKDSFLKPFHYSQEGKKQYALCTRLDIIKRKGGLRGQYLHYLYLLGYLPKYKRKQNPNRVHYLLRDDLLKLDKITDEIRLLGENHIDTSEQLLSFKEDTLGKIKILEEKRKGLRNEVRRKLPEEQQQKIKEKISEVSRELKPLRKDVRLCESIYKRSFDITDKLECIEREEKGREEKANEFRR